jgi:hypothetical protein
MAVSPSDLRAMLVDGNEIALLDVREEGEFGANHILLAVNVPMSLLELRASNLVPRAGTRVVLCDDNGGELAAQLGCNNLATPMLTCSKVAPTLGRKPILKPLVA